MSETAARAGSERKTGRPGKTGRPCGFDGQVLSVAVHSFDRLSGNAGLTLLVREDRQIAEFILLASVR